MKHRLVQFQVKKLLWPALLLALLFAALNAGGVYLFNEGTVEMLSEARAQGPALFSMPGVGGSATLGSHLASLVYGFLLPLLGGLYAARLPAWLVADKVETGEICYWLSLPHSRARFVGRQALVLAALLLLPPLGGFLGGAVGAFALKPEAPLHPGWHALLNGGLYCWLMLAGSLGLFISSGAEIRARAARASTLLLLLFFAVGVAGMTVGVPSFVQWFSPWRYYMPQDLALGRGSLPILVLPGLTGVLLLLAI